MPGSGARLRFQTDALVALSSFEPRLVLKLAGLIGQSIEELEGSLELFDQSDLEALVEHKLITLSVSGDRLPGRVSYVFSSIERLIEFANQAVMAVADRHLEELGEYIQGQIEAGEA